MSSLAVVLVGVIIQGYEIGNYWLATLLGSAVVFLVTAGGNALNDYFDREVDLINHPERPIPSGEITPRKAIFFGTLLFLLGIIISGLINLLTFIIAVLATALLLLYERNLKKLGFVGNVTVSALVGLLFIFGGAIYGKIPLVSVFAMMAFSSNLGREIVKDIEDMGGDVDRKTLPMKIGKKNAGITATIFFLIAVALSPLPYLFGYFDMYYLLAVTISDIIFIYSSIIHFKDPHRGQKSAKAAMALGLLAYLVGALA